MTATSSESRSNPAVLLSTLWIFVTLNYLYCDVLGLTDPIILRQMLAGGVEGIPMTQGFLMAAAVLMEIPISLVILSRWLPYRANRIANILGGSIMTAVQIASLFAGSGPTAYYCFFSAIEIATTVFIVWYAWNWKLMDLDKNSIAPTNENTYERG